MRTLVSTIKPIGGNEALQITAQLFAGQGIAYPAAMCGNVFQGAIAIKHGEHG